MLTEKNIILGVTGGIAAYKAVEIIRLLTKAGADIHVIMTEAAAKFVTPLTFREISGNPVITDLWEEPKKWNVEHIALASLADLFLIAPATANIIGKIANGIADDMLSTTVMATRSPVFFAPAMNTNMYANPIVQQNIDKLTRLGYYFLEPDSGMLACGTEGQGRLPDPAVIVRQIIQFFHSVSHLQHQFAGKRFLITAGGTREPLDPVRYLGNRSSGKMGYALAEAAAARGAQVVLVSGPTSLVCPKQVTMIPVETAEEMRQAVLAEFPATDIVIKAAAVADYRPLDVHAQKIKKTDAALTITLQKNPDILAELGELKQHQILVGFAAETQDLVNNAAEKLARKNLDMIIANDVTQPGAGFNADTNIIKILHKDGSMEAIPRLAKKQLAEIILDRLYHSFCEKC